MRYKNDLMTLENYCERYLPIVIMNTCSELMMPIFDNDKDRKKLNKQFDKMHLYISRAILND